MKILWFANTPCGAREKLEPNSFNGGWLSSLETALVEQDNIELYIAFYWGKNLAPFKYKKTNYYPVLRKGSGSKIGRLINRFLDKMDDKNEIPRLLKVIDAVKPDIIHVHGTEDNFGLVQQYTIIPTVVSIQGLLSPYTEKFFSGIPLFSAVIYEGLLPKLKFGSFYSSFKKIKKLAIREQAILKLSQNIMGRTAWDNRITRILATNSQYFIGNEMLRPSFHEKKWNKKEFGAIIQIVSISTGSLYKGLETIVKAAQILKHNNSIAFKWIVIGQSESGMFAKTVKRWLKCNYKSLGVQLVGSKNEQEVVDILSNSDIYCQVSHIENSPNSLCEAMLIGMPIVASFAGGTDSMLENGKEGILVQDGDPYSCAGAICEMVNDFEKSVFFGKYAFERASKRHNKNTIIKDLLSHYNAVILKTYNQNRNY